MNQPPGKMFRSCCVSAILAALALSRTTGCVHGARINRINSFAGPFIGYAEKIHRCEGMDYSNHRAFVNLYPSYFRPHYTTPQTLTGNVTLLGTLTDHNTWGIGRLDTWSNNQWKENAFIFKFDGGLCSGLRDTTPAFWLLFNKPEKKGPCIWPKGFWRLDHAPINWTFPRIPVMPYGRWRLHMTVGPKNKPGSVITCVQFECVTAPKVIREK